MITQKIIARTDSLKLDKIISRYGEDSMRQVVFIIVRPDPESEELIPITIPEDAVGSFRILKPSGNFVIVPMNKSVLATGETAFDVVLPASANTAKGSGYYDIRITSDTDKYYFTAQGDFLIDDNIISDEVLEDVSEVNGLIFPDDFLTVEDNAAYIDDDTISTDSTWSSNKINEEIEAHAGGDVSKTVSGNPVIFTDGADAPLVKCVTEIQGSQDLHGYDKPWVGGAYINKMPPGEAKTETINGVTCTSDGNGKYTFNGTPTASVQFIIPVEEFTILDNANSAVYFFNSFALTSLTFMFFYNNDVVETWSLQSINRVSAYTAMRGRQCNKIMITFGVGTPIVDGVIMPMLAVGTSYTAWTPYSNICPITAYTEGEIEVSDGDGNVTTHTTTYPSAIYRGSEDVVNGEVTSEYRYAEITDALSGLSYNSTIGACQVANLGFKKNITEETKSQYISNRLKSAKNSGLANFSYEFTVDGNGTLIFKVPNMTSLSDYISWLATNPLEFSGPLETPTTSSVTPTNLPIKSLSGYNHIESTTGDMEVEYITQRFQPLIDSIKQL